MNFLQGAHGSAHGSDPPQRQGLGWSREVGCRGGWVRDKVEALQNLPDVRFRTGGVQVGKAGPDRARGVVAFQGGRRHAEWSPDRTPESEPGGGLVRLGPWGNQGLVGICPEDFLPRVLLSRHSPGIIPQPPSDSDGPAPTLFMRTFCGDGDVLRAVPSRMVATDHAWPVTES